MAVYTANIHWMLEANQSFSDNRYSRAHTWTFDGGVIVPASSSPAVVPTPMSSPEAVDPEEAFVASLSSCHMLWFLSIAAKRGFRVSEYTDHARGTIGKDASGKVAMIRVDLSPHARFTGERHPANDEVEIMHQVAHENCYIANSVKADVVCSPEY